MSPVIGAGGRGVGEDVMLGAGCRWVVRRRVTGGRLKRLREKGARLAEVSGQLIRKLRVWNRMMVISYCDRVIRRD